MTSPWTGRVVVGIDGSPHSFRAADWAADWAITHEQPLGLIAAHGLAPATQPESFADLVDVARENAESDLAEAVRRVTQTHPTLDVHSEVVQLGAAEALTSVSEHADTLVIGNRGLGPIKEKFLGGVATKVVTYSHCPVITVPLEASPADGPIVVGLDGSQHSAHAAEFAFAHADLSGNRVVAVTSWSLDVRFEAGLISSMPVPDFAAMDNALRSSLTEWLSPVVAKYPNVDVEQRVLEGNPAVSLLSAAEGASLLVVGSRGHGAFARLLLGSTSTEVVRAAECAVAIVR